MSDVNDDVVNECSVAHWNRWEMQRENTSFDREWRLTVESTCVSFLLDDAISQWNAVTANTKRRIYVENWKFKVISPQKNTRKVALDDDDVEADDRNDVNINGHIQTVKSGGKVVDQKGKWHVCKSFDVFHMNPNEWVNEFVCFFSLLTVFFVRRKWKEFESAKNTNEKLSKICWPKKK